MASATDIQSTISAALQQQAQQLESQLAAWDEFISKLMEKVELKETEASSTSSPKPDKGNHVSKGFVTSSQPLGLYTPHQHTQSSMGLGVHLPWMINTPIKD
ncbi:uncharacterized protein PGTG_17810 [Puccinia graminis f. sp. tritici CRL 75-36-700-3]|uniref:Uncharacterized protein n=1 Tax=Puccinia graminis f. sp. tritici (strain CRL 75-36-700-3 / race SCCL) TaxID=418459 RepID=E3L5I5_PUCGT|nr:uncharacterized protein PGTG_17810 [Puccinia graminis f. sp. tritici CRL 75-36-700-3]EFP91810.1 hypothetical protein PGTG_17810 [Puccinia graminis f. sp. tritici CRL 75-36-700-3]